jgi:hypothetical protein
MTTSARREEPTPLAVRVFFSSEDKLGVVLTDGREVWTPTSWFPCLRKAERRTFGVGSKDDLTISPLPHAESVSGPNFAGKIRSSVCRSNGTNSPL